MPPRRVASRTVLRPPRADDRDEFLARVAASRALHGSWVCPPSDAASFAAYLDRCARPDFVGHLACRREDGAIAGVFNVSQIVLGLFQSAYLGYFAFTPLAGQGYMTEALEQVVRHAFGPIGLHRLEANIQPGNDASRALVSRFGFRLEGFSPRYLKVAGRWRDHERWAILSDDFYAARGR